MTDLRAMSATDLVDWLRRQTSDGVDVLDLLLITAAGITDLDAVTRHREHLTQARTELCKLTDSGQQFIDPPLDVRDITGIVAVGHTVYRHDRDNLDAWLAMAALIRDVDPEIRDDWRPRFKHARHLSWTDEATRLFIVGLLEAGRGPLYGRELIARAVETGTSPDTYGYSITPGQFSDLAKVGIGGAELDRLAEHGIEREEAIELISKHIPAGAIVAAIETNVPREQWDSLLPGMNPDWFPLHESYAEDHRYNPIKSGILSQHSAMYAEAGWTWEHLRRLVDAGWGTVSSIRLREVRYGHGRGGGTLVITADIAVHIAETGIRYDEFARWLGALSERSRTEYSPEHVKKALLYVGPKRLDEIMAAILALRAAKVAPSSITDYRWAGCTSVEQILQAAEAGINGPRVKHLRAAYGERKYRHDPKYLRDLAALLDVHQRDLEAVAGKDSA